MGGFVALADDAGAAVSNEELVSGTNGAGAGGASSLTGAGGFVVVAAEEASRMTASWAVPRTRSAPGSASVPRPEAQVPEQAAAPRR